MCIRDSLDDILFIAIIGMVGGATSFETIHAFAQCRHAWLKTILKLPHGIPSHDTIYRVFCALDAKVFSQCLGDWLAEWCDTIPGLRHIAVDGKSLRGARGDTFTGCIHLVEAWATEAGLLLGQEVVAAKSNEIPALPPLLKALNLKGALVTIDAAGCQTSVAATIREQKGDYLLCVKGNQESLRAAVEGAFARAIAADFAGVPHTRHTTVDTRHGRQEERYITVIPPPADLPADWPDVACLVQVNRERTTKAGNASTTHYYISSLAGTAEQLGHLIRRHWAIENELHWSLDVIFDEDANRTRDRNASANLGVVRRLAVSLLTRAPGKKSKPIKMILAAGDTNYLEDVLRQISAI
jgi:predicted transposase YbfD/YdcC